MWTKYTALATSLSGMFRLITSSALRHLSSRPHERRGRNAFEAFMLEYADKQQRADNSPPYRPEATLTAPADTGTSTNHT